MPRHTHPIHDLPRIVRFEGVHDSGEYGNASCPHCGADGRYVWTFTVEDGRTLGAMSGCLKLYPVSPLAEEHKRIIERQKQRAKRDGKLASWDVAKLEAIAAVASGEMDENTGLAIVERENAKRTRWMERKGFRR